MPHWSSAVFAIIGLTAALVTIGTVLGASFRTSNRATALNNYRELAESYRMKTEEQAVQIQELQTENAERDKQVTALSVKVETLTDLLTNRVAIHELSATIGHIDLRMAEAVSQLGETRASVGRIEATLAQGGQA